MDEHLWNGVDTIGSFLNEEGVRETRPVSSPICGASGDQRMVSGPATRVNVKDYSQRSR